MLTNLLTNRALYLAQQGTRPYSRLPYREDYMALPETVKRITQAYRVQTWIPPRYLIPWIPQAKNQNEKS